MSQYPTTITINTPQGYRRHGLLRGLLVLLMSGPLGLLLYTRGSGAVGAVIGGVVLTALLLIAASVVF